MQQQAPQENFFERAGWIANLLLFLARCFSVTVEVFLHRDMGPRAIGLRGLVGAALIFFFPVAFPQHDARPLLAFLALYLIACGWARTSALCGRLGSQTVHSFYTGVPRISRLLPSFSELGLKRAVEPLLVFQAALVSAPCSEPLAAFLLLASGALFVSVNATVLRDESRARDLIDASIDQQSLAERFRELQHLR